MLIEQIYRKKEHWTHKNSNEKERNIRRNYGCKSQDVLDVIHREIREV